MKDKLLFAAWIDENDNSTIYGTHDPEVARAIFHEYLELTGYEPWSEEWPSWANDLEAYGRLLKLWTRPKDFDVPLDTYTLPGPGLIPYLFTSI